MERSYVLQKTFREISKILGQRPTRQELPDFNKEFNKSAKLLLHSITRVLEIQEHFKKEADTVHDKLAHEKKFVLFFERVMIVFLICGWLNLLNGCINSNRLCVKLPKINKNSRKVKVD